MGIEPMITKLMRGRAAAVDIGTVNTLIALDGKGIVLREPSVAALDTSMGGSIAACGSAALELAARSPGKYELAWPLKDGVVADLTLASGMLGFFMKKVLAAPLGMKTGALGMRLALCIPLEISSIERRALEETAKSVGARDVLITEEPVAAAFGAGIPIFEPVGAMIMDIGGGTSDIAVISLGGIAAQRSLRLGGNHMDDAIALYIARQYGVSISERTAEEIKLTLARATQGRMERMQIRGRNMKNGLPASLVVNSGEISHAISPVVSAISEAVRQVLYETPPELASDLLSTGITLTGGGAHLPGLAKLISSRTGLCVNTPASAMDCVVLGALKLLSMPQAFANTRLA